MTDHWPQLRDSSLRNELRDLRAYKAHQMTNEPEDSFPHLMLGAGLLMVALAVAFVGAEADSRLDALEARVEALEPDPGPVDPTEYKRPYSRFRGVPADER